MLKFSPTKNTFLLNSAVRELFDLYVTICYFVLNAIINIKLVKSEAKAVL